MDSAELRISRFGYAVSISVAALLAGCGGSQPPIGTPGAIKTNLTASACSRAEQVRRVSCPLHSLILCAAIAVSLSAPPLVNSAAGFPVRTGIFRTQLESDKAVYRAGQPIRLRIIFINNTDHYFNYRWMPVWGLCGLIVDDEQGHLLVSKGNRGGFVSSGMAAQFRPREIKVADFYDPETKDNPLSQWVRLDYWGYDLNNPGVYTIMAFPTIAAWESYSQYSQKGGPEFLTSSADKSNAVHIMIVK